MTVNMCQKYEAAFTLLGKRWTGLIIRAILVGQHRFSEIAQLIPLLNDRMVTPKGGVIRPLRRLRIRGGQGQGNDSMLRKRQGFAGGRYVQQRCGALFGDMAASASAVNRNPPEDGAHRLSPASPSKSGKRRLYISVQKARG